MLNHRTKRLLNFQIQVQRYYHLGELEEAREEGRDGPGEHQEGPDDEAGRPPAVAAAGQLHAACDMAQKSVIRAVPLGHDHRRLVDTRLPPGVLSAP